MSPRQSKLLSPGGIYLVPRKVISQLEEDNSRKNLLRIFEDSVERIQHRVEKDF